MEILSNHITFGIRNLYGIVFVFQCCCDLLILENIIFVQCSVSLILLILENILLFGFVNSYTRIQQAYREYTGVEVH